MREYIVQYERKEADNPKDKCDLCNHAIVGELVRCKDCRHAYFKDFDGYCPHMVNMLKPDGFCYRGERQCNYFGERREP